MAAGVRLHCRGHLRRFARPRGIVSTIARIIADKPEFQGIQAIHVDYVKREADSGHTQTIDGIDFRRDPQGNFQRHIT
jgi:hypothetical protein